MIIKRPHWAFSGHYLFQALLLEDRVQVYALEGLDHHWDLLPSFPAEASLLVFIPSNMEEFSFRFAAAGLERQNPGLDPRNVLWLCNYPAQVDWARAAGFEAILCHQNAFIDEHIFQITNQEEPREFTLVLNSRPENVKRPWLAAGIQRLAVIKGKLYKPEEFSDLSLLDPAFMNEERLTLQQVQAIYNRSSVGGIFSAAEGGCLASGEYLLSGLPVLSTFSRGGRDTYYTEFNSLVVDPTNEAVRAGLATIQDGLQSGRFNRKRIREHHCNLSEQMRLDLRQKLTCFLAQRAVEPEASSRAIVGALRKRRVHWLPRGDVIAQIRHPRAASGGSPPYQRFLERGEQGLLVTGFRKLETRRELLYLTPTRTKKKHFVSFVFDVTQDADGHVRSLLLLDLRSGGYPYAVVELISLAGGAEYAKVAARIGLWSTAQPLPEGWCLMQVLHGLAAPTTFLRLEIPVPTESSGMLIDALHLRVYVDSHGEYMPAGDSSISIVSPVIVRREA